MFGDDLGLADLLEQDEGHLFVAELSLELPDESLPLADRIGRKFLKKATSLVKGQWRWCRG